MSSIFSRGAAGASNASMGAGSIRPRRKKQRCAQCGSKKWHRDKASGRVVCELGHVRLNWRDEEAADDEWMNGLPGTQRPTTRRRNGTRREVLTRAGKPLRAKRVGRAARYLPDKSSYLSPAHGVFRVAQACQALLRLQLAALRRVWPDLPHLRIEAVARDIWASLLADAQRPGRPGQKVHTLPAAPYHADDPWFSIPDTRVPDDVGLERQRSRSRSRSVSRSRASSAALSGTESEGFTSAGYTSDGGMSAGSWTSYASSGARSTRNMESLVPFPPDPSSGAETDGSGVDRESATSRAYRRRPRHLDAMLQGSPTGAINVQATLGVVYLALWVVRIPVHLSDLLLMAKAGEIPYLLAGKALPVDVLHGINRGLARHVGFHMQEVPSLAEFHALARRLSVLASLPLDQETQIPPSDNLKMPVPERYLPKFEVPPLNGMPLLWSFTQRMLLPPAAYAVAKAILLHAVPGLYLGPESQPAGVQAWERTSLAKHRKFSWWTRGVPGEVFLVAALVVVAKMRYGLDGALRTEAGRGPKLHSGLPRLQAWLTALRDLHVALTRHPSAAYDPEACPVEEMDEAQLDALLDFAERTVVNPCDLEWNVRGTKLDAGAAQLLSQLPGHFRPPRAGAALYRGVPSAHEGVLRSREQATARAWERLYGPRARLARLAQLADADADAGPGAGADADADAARPVSHRALPPGAAYQLPPSPFRVDLSRDAPLGAGGEDYLLVLRVAGDAVGCPAGLVSQVAGVLEHRLDRSLARAMFYAVRGARGPDPTRTLSRSRSRSRSSSRSSSRPCSRSPPPAQAARQAGPGAAHGADETDGESGRPRASRKRTRTCRRT